MNLKVLFALCVLVVPAHVLGYCNSYELSKCVDGTSFEKYKNSHNQQLFVYHSQRELAKLCRDVKYVKSCQARHIEGCSQAVRGLFEGVQDAFHYMCEDGHFKYMRNRQCLGGRTLSINTKKCETTMNSELAEFRSESGRKGSDERKKELCGFIHEAKKCVHDYVQAACGNDAAEFEETFMNKMLKPLMALVNCAEPVHILNSPLRPKTEPPYGGYAADVAQQERFQPKTDWPTVISPEYPYDPVDDRGPIATILIISGSLVGSILFFSCLGVLLCRCLRQRGKPGHVIMLPNGMESGHGTAFENPLSGYPPPPYSHDSSPATKGEIKY